MDEIKLEEIIATALMTPLVNETRHVDPSSPFCRWGVPLVLSGLSGCGKTEQITDVCNALGLPSWKLFPSYMQPEDLGGVPIPTPDGIVLECILPQVNALIEKGVGVLFVDELSTARPAVQAVCLGLFDERRAGDKILPPKARIIGAMNPPEYAASGYSYAAPLANRLAHFSYNTPSPTEWISWFSGTAERKLPHFQNAEQQVIERWNDAWARTQGLAIGFMRTHGETLLHDQPKPNDPRSSGAWPSHRMWHYGLCAYTAARCLDFGEHVQNTMLFSCVGDTVEAAWIEYVEKADLPPPEEVLAGGWIPDTKRLDVTEAVMSSTTLWLTSLKDIPKKQKLAGPAWSLVAQMCDAGIADMALPYASRLVTNKLTHRNQNQEAAKAAEEAIGKLSDAGVAVFAD